MLDWVASKLGFVRASAVVGEIQAARAMGYTHHPAISSRFQLSKSIAEQLDEHRALVELISENTSLFDDQPALLKNIAETDDFLMRMYRAVHGAWPNGQDQKKGQKVESETRPRPSILGICGLYEYNSRR
jgi:hypothetical protein